MFCLVGVFGLLQVGEALWRAKILRGENLRKFIHMSVGSFIAIWPWLISWRAIQIVGVAMLAVVLINRYFRFFHFSSGIGREEYGDIFLASAIVICALLTDVKSFFAIAILQVSIADGVAAMVGKRVSRRWKYKVYHQTKTVLGSMAFWLASFFIIAAGVPLGAHNFINFQDYVILLLALPPVLTVVENVSGLGLDNLSVPLVTLLALHLAQTV